MDSKEVIADIKKIFTSKWESRDGRIVPDTDSLKLGNDAIKLNATVLYADMADSTNLVDQFKPWFAAEIYKAYLIGACRVIRDKRGEITAFDGDRVMAVFTGNFKNSAAVEAALKIKFLGKEINNQLKISYPNTSYELKQSVGIDTSPLYVVKTGIREFNDLVWVGRAANYAAKLSALGDAAYQTFITEDVYKQLNESSKFGGNPKKEMWEKRTWTEMGITIYRSNWQWKF
jgi:class 3 adenylate cyclase